MKTVLAFLISISMVFLHGAARAEDIDLFAVPATTTKYLPNILIVLDNTANWDSSWGTGTAFSNEIAALKSVLAKLDPNTVKVGLMLYSETGAGDGNPDGAYLRAAVRPMSETNKTLYTAMLQSLDHLKDRGNGRKLAMSMAEAYEYYAGKAAYAGANKKKRDFKGNSISGYDASNAVYGLVGNALSSPAATSYTSPIENGCQLNFIIYIGNTSSNGSVSVSNASDNSIASALLAAAAAGKTVTQIPISPSGLSEDYANEWTRWMKAESGLDITTFVIDVSGGTTGNGPANSALLKSMAVEGGGGYFRVDATQSSDLSSDIAKAFGNIVSQIQAVNSVFASVSLPVSVNTQGTYLNQVFIGMFRPGERATPRWSGNLKQYKIGFNGSELQLQDAAAAPAINARTGFVAECARSYWTPVDADAYWKFKTWPKDTSFCISGSNSSVDSNSPDGNVVEKGGQALNLRSSANRRLYTCGSSMAGCANQSTLAPASVNSLSMSVLGAASAAEQSALVNYLLGFDVDNERLADTPDQMRPSVHGDVVHSRPVAVNFGGATEASSNVVVFYGGNDGLLRAVNGNRGDGTGGGAIGPYVAGAEIWSFLPPEFQSRIKRLRDNKTLVYYAGETYGAGVVTAPKDYGMDGPITAWRGKVGGADKSFVYASMRRGGRSIYAFDVSAIATSPADVPALKWRIGCSGPADTDCSPGMSTIGQTWTSLKPFTTAGYGADKPLLIFGGGYDACEDYDGGAGAANNKCVGTSKGHAVYVVDAVTGALVKSFDTGGIRGIVADVTLVRDTTGQVMLGYTADLGGNVYRIQFGSGDASSWTITRIASLGCDTVGACTANRKFMFAPSVVTTDAISLNATYYLMLGSGDREKPTVTYAASYGVPNHFFMIQDKPGTAASTFPGSSCGSTVICLASLLPITSSVTPSATDLASKQGWYLALNAHEQVVTSAVTVFGNVTFSTHQPAIASPESCKSNLGTTLVYNVGYTNAAPLNKDRASEVAGDGLPPSPVAGQVTIDDKTVPFCFGCSATSPLEASLPKGAASSNQSKMRLYWYINRSTP